MSPPAETTPLRGAPRPPPAPPSRWSTVRYGFFFALFLFCNLFALAPQAFIPRAFLLNDPTLFKLSMLVVVDYVTDICWLPLAQVLEYAGSLAVGCQPDPRQRRAVRKSESLNALGKSLLRLLSFIGTMRVALEQLGLLFILPAIAYLAITAAYTVALAKLARMVQDRRAARDDAL